MPEDRPTPWAEVIGDPIVHSRSPEIHEHWLRALGLDGIYRATRVPCGHLAEFLTARRADPGWRGCNVTAPHKRAIVPFIDRLCANAQRTGAVNCVVRDPTLQSEGLFGANTDIDGISEALADTAVAKRKAVLIGAGGAARAALAWLSEAGADPIICLARDPAKAAQDLPGVEIRALGAGAIHDAQLIINASPLGMGHAVMPATVLADLATAAPGATAFDMVYQPLDTQFLLAARACGLRTVNGLDMLVGQARRSFQLFFGSSPLRDSGADARAASRSGLTEAGLTLSR